MFYLLWKKEEISALIIQNTIEEKKNFQLANES